MILSELRKIKNRLKYRPVLTESYYVTYEGSFWDTSNTGDYYFGFTLGSNYSNPVFEVADNSNMSATIIKPAKNVRKIYINVAQFSYVTANDFNRIFKMNEGTWDVSSSSTVMHHRSDTGSTQHVHVNCHMEVSAGQCIVVAPRKKSNKEGMINVGGYINHDNIKN